LEKLKIEINTSTKKEEDKVDMGDFLEVFKKSRMHPELIYPKLVMWEKILAEYLVVINNLGNTLEPSVTLLTKTLKDIEVNFEGITDFNIKYVRKT
jgi:hypothetical protein